MSFIREKKVGGKIYYFEVENRRINGKVVQKHLRYFGKDRNKPAGIPLERVQFGYIATRLMQGDLSPNELCDMIEKMGNCVGREDLERIGLYYDFKKKLLFHFTVSEKIGRESENCRECGKRLTGYHTYPRTIRTLSGILNLRVHVRIYRDHGTGSAANPVGGSDFDLRVTIAVGMLRFLLDYQRSEIQVLMESRGIGMSTGEISNLTREFLLRFYCSHRKHMKDLDLSEYLLNLDGTV